MIKAENEFPRDLILNRLNLFIERIKTSGVDLECIPGLTKQARLNYRQRGNIPASKNLLAWSTTFDLNINWLLLGEGSMLRTNAQAEKNLAAHTSAASAHADDAQHWQTESFRLLNEAYCIQKKLICAHEKVIELQDIISKSLHTTD